MGTARPNAAGPAKRKRQVPWKMSWDRLGLAIFYKQRTRRSKMRQRLQASWNKTQPTALDRSTREPPLPYEADIRVSCTVRRPPTAGALLSIPKRRRRDEDRNKRCELRSCPRDEELITHAMEDKEGFDLEAVAYRLKREFAPADLPLPHSMEKLLERLRSKHSPRPEHDTFLLEGFL